MEEKASFGAYIRRKRLEVGLTQKELAGRLFVTESSVSKWERNLSYPDVSLITAICRELGISEHEFFTACDDDQAQVEERQAVIWRRVKLWFRRCCLAGYALALVVCPICDLAVNHTLSWFWIVLPALALSFCVTNMPWLVERNRLSVCLGAGTACLLQLLLASWFYVGERWLLGGLAITAVSLALPWGWWAIWRFYGEHVLPLCVTLTSVWVFPLLAVIHLFAGGDWLFQVSYPLAAVGVVFMWAYFICLRYLPLNPWLKAGVFTLITAAAPPVFNALCRRLILGTGGPRALDHVTLTVLLAVSFLLLVIGGMKAVRRREL